MTWMTDEHLRAVMVRIGMSEEAARGMTLVPELRARAAQVAELEERALSGDRDAGVRVAYLREHIEAVMAEARR